jgi:predicted Zn-dependent protease
MDPSDATNKADKNLMEEVVHQSAMIDKCGAEDHGMNEDIDYEKAASYCNSILKNCPGSIHYAEKRIEYLLRSSQLKEADAFSQEVLKRAELMPSSRLNAWRGRVLIYTGNEDLGRKMLT